MKMLIKTALVLVFLCSTECFTPNCVPTNQFKFYAFPVEGCSESYLNMCHFSEMGYFQSKGNPTLVKILETELLPTCAFYNSPSLKHIYGVKSDIKVLAQASFFNLPNLTSINLAFNHITEVRDQTFKNVSAEILDLSWNEIIFIDKDAFKELYNLKHLNLSRNSLTTVPMNYLSMTIESLNLAHNFLSRIAINSQRFFNLSRVNFSNNKIGNLAISFIYPLEEIDLTSNLLEDLDYVEIVSVETFKLGSNGFTVVPRYIENINAKKLHIYPNPWKCDELNKLWELMRTLNYKIGPATSTSKTAAVCANVGKRPTTSIRDAPCEDDKDCPLDMACRTGKCLNPCLTFCDKSSICTAENHKFTCSCPKGLLTSPLDLTFSCQNVKCYTKRDCPEGGSCYNNECIFIAHSQTGESVIPSGPKDSIADSQDIKPWWFDDIPKFSP